MKIAIPVENNGLHGHFGGSRQFAIVEVDSEAKQILRTETLTAPEHAPGVYPRWLAELGVQRVIAGGIGERALMLFTRQHITVLAGRPGETVENVIHAYLNGGITGAPTGCAHHGHGHGQDHPHGHGCHNHEA